MENKKEILLIAQKLTELRLKQKMLKWAFENSKGLPEEKMNAILDEKLRIDHLIKMPGKRSNPKPAARWSLPRMQVPCCWARQLPK